ncbi:MAG: hypothetical protein ACKO3V_07280 [Pirellula sp.]
MRNLLYITTCLILSLLCLGCKEPQGDALEQEHEHFPVHWPQDILSASKRMSQLLTDPTADATAKSSAQKWPTASTEFADLVGWLPILAADSDLGRQEFAQIDSWSSRWTESLRKHALESPDIRGLSNLEELRQVVSQLEEICQAEQERLDRFAQDL